MNWESFFIGIGCFALAYLMRRLDKWGYGVKPESGSYEYMKTVNGWIFIIFLILVGVGFLIASLPSEL